MRSGTDRQRYLRDLDVARGAGSGRGVRLTLATSAPDPLSFKNPLAWL